MASPRGRAAHSSHTQSDVAREPVLLLWERLGGGHLVFPGCDDAASLEANPLQSPSERGEMGWLFLCKWGQMDGLKRAKERGKVGCMDGNLWPVFLSGTKKSQQPHPLRNSCSKNISHRVFLKGAVHFHRDPFALLVWHKVTIYCAEVFFFLFLAAAIVLYHFCALMWL